MASKTSFATTKQLGLTAAKYSSSGLSGDYIAKVIPVPFPNTEVKLCEPMIVPTSVKVGIARFLKNPLVSAEGFFCARIFPVKTHGWIVSLTTRQFVSERNLGFRNSGS